VPADVRFLQDLFGIISGAEHPVSYSKQSAATIIENVDFLIRRHKYRFSIKDE
jgi:hypothetical protein